MTTTITIHQDLTEQGELAQPVYIIRHTDGQAFEVTEQQAHELAASIETARIECGAAL